MSKITDIWHFGKKRPLVFYSLLTIGLLNVLAITAYTHIGDNSPGANHQIPEIALKPAFYKVNILQIKGGDVEESSMLKGIFTGFKKSYQEVPYDSLSIDGPTLTVVLNGKTRFFKTSEIYGYKDGSSDLPVFKRTYLLGTDKYGRSVWSRLVLGIRISLLVGLLAVVVSLLVGVTVGALGGYYGGFSDQILLYFINVVWAIPTLLLVFAIVLALGRGMGIIFLAIGLTMWVDVARIVRGQVMEAKNQLYVQAAQSIGQKQLIILFRHILPNIMGPILVITAANFATAILVEAGLSYLGFGINPPTPSLGNMLNENYGYALSGNYTISLAPALIVSLLVLCFNLLGTGLRDVFDIKQSARH